MTDLLELSADQLSRMLNTGLARAKMIEAKVSVAVVDRGGNLAAFLRQPGAFLVSSDLAIDKAWTAASFAMATRAFGEALASESPEVRDGLLARPRVTVIPGGVPILVEGICIGAVGISGASAQQDEEIAQVVAGTARIACSS